MQKIHTKLTQQYPKYNNWHQTKHHNKVHWGVFLLYSLVVFLVIINPLEVNIDAYSLVLRFHNAQAAYTVRSDHPRLYITKDNLAAIRTKIQTYYKKEFQDYVNWLDGNFDKTLNNPAETAAILSYAFMHQIGQLPGFTYGHTIQEYGNVAKTALLRQADIYLSTKKGLDRFPIFSVGYDWLFGLFTLAEKQKLVDAMIYRYENAIELDKGGITWGYAVHDRRDVIVGGLAFYGDGINDIKAKEMADKFPLWEKGLNLENFIAADDGGGTVGYAYEGYVVGLDYNFLTDAWNTATGQNYFQTSTFFRYFPQWIAYGVMPFAEPEQKSPGGYNFKLYKDHHGQNGMYAGFWHQAALSSLLASYKNIDANMTGLNQWLIQNRTGPINYISTDREHYVFHHFIWGDRSLPPKSPSSLTLPLTKKFDGLGWVVMRQGFEDIKDMMATFLAMPYSRSGSGYWSAFNQNSFTITKRAPLALNTGSGGHHDYANSTVAHNTIIFPNPDDPYNYSYADQGGQRISFPSLKSVNDLQSGSSYDIGGLKRFESVPGEYDYMLGDATRAYNSSQNKDAYNEAKIDLFTRQFVYLRQQTNTESDYFVVFDRTNTLDTKFEKRWLLHMSYDPEIRNNGQTQTGALEREGKWVYPKANEVVITNDYGSADGRLFSKTLLPTNTKIVKIGGPNHEFETTVGIQDTGGVHEPLPLSQKDAFWLGSYRTEVIPTVKQNYDTFLHVMQTTDTTVNTMVPTKTIDSTNMVGTLIEDPKAARIVLFSKSEALQDQVSYQASYTGQGKHLLADISEGIYTITQNGVKIAERTVSKKQATKYSPETPYALYFSASGGGTFTITKTDSVPDTQAPVISGVASSQITSSSATITWTTDEPATSQVEYGLTADYGSLTFFDSSLTSNHSVLVSGITPDTMYHYRVKSQDSSSNQSSSGDFTFTTLPTDDIDAPIISNVTASQITENSAVITWTTNEPATSQVEYGTTQSYGGLTDIDTTLNQNHSVTLTGLTSQTLYYYRVKSKDSSSNEAVSSQATFTTQGVQPPPPADTYLINFQPDTAATPSGYQKDSGKTYASTRGYGWNIPVSTRERNAHPDKRLDTFVSDDALKTWEYDLPNSDYLVSLASGDPSFYKGPQQVKVENETVIAETEPTEPNQFVTVTDYPIQVLDGKLTVVIGTGVSGESTALNYVIIRPAEPSPYKQSDLNQDTKVNQLDFDILKQDFNRTDKPISDINQDGVVDSKDLGIMMSEWTK